MSCPNCGSTSVEQKTKGYLKGPDKNPAKCLSCGWLGKAWQLNKGAVFIPPCTEATDGDIVFVLSNPKVKVCIKGGNA